MREGHRQHIAAITKRIDRTLSLPLTGNLPLLYALMMLNTWRQTQKL
jgi:hypothetical protein